MATKTVNILANSAFRAVVLYAAGSLLTSAANAAPQITTTTLPAGTIGAVYSTSLGATGGTGASYTWVLASGSLPPGLTLNTSTGAISGTTTTAGGSPFSFTVKAADTAGRVSAAQGLSIAVAALTTPTSVSLARSPNPVIYGHAVTLTAIVTPGTATGKVTFFDGVNVLGASPVAGGQAALTTSLLTSGSHSLKAYFNGQPSYLASTSTAVAETVSPVAAGGFQAPITYSNGNGSGPAISQLVTGDFNGDGKTDLALDLGVALGNGNGTFQALIPFPGNAQVAQVAADFNGDGKTDLATSTGVLLGNGDGTFQPVIPYPAGAGAMQAVADFNGDGVADLLQTDGRILPGNGDGTFQQPLAGISGGGNVVVGDFNGDGKADIATADSFVNIGATYTARVYLGNGDGTFQAAVIIDANVGAAAVALLTGDLNGDGKADLVLCTFSAGNKVYLGNGAGPFSGGIPFTAGLPSPGLVSGRISGAAALGDFNGDGKLDVATAEDRNNNDYVNVLLGNGDGTFQAAVLLSTGTRLQLVAVGDFNGDGRADVAASPHAAFAISILRGAAAGSPQITTTMLPVGTIGAVYSTSLAASGGTPPYSNWTVGSGSLPPGLSLNSSTGVIGGTPTTAGNASFTATMQDSAASASPVQALSISVNPAAGGGTGGGGGAPSGGNPLIVSPDTLNLTAAANGTPTTRTISLQFQTYTEVAPAFSSTITTNQGVGWLSATPAAGTMIQTSYAGFLYTYTATVTISVDPTGISAGSAYQGTANFSAGGGIAPTAVTMNVVSRPAVYAASPPSLNFTWRKGDSVPAAQNVSLSSVPTGTPFAAAPTTSGGGNWLSAAAPSGTTPETVVVSLNSGVLANLAPDRYAGKVTISGNNATAVDIPVTLAVTRDDAPVISNGGVVPVYGTASTIQSGSWISIFGTNLAAAQQVWNGDFPTSLGGVTVTVDGKPGYLWYVSPTQINLQAPDDPATGTVTVAVTTPTGSFTSTVTLDKVSPSFSLLDATHVAALSPNPDGTYDIVGPSGAFAYETRPIKAGDSLILYGVGFGPTDPPVPAGQPYSSAAATINPVTVTISEVPAPVVYSGLVGAGLYQINVTVPDGLPSGDQPLRATVSGLHTRVGPVVTIR